MQNKTLSTKIEKILSKIANFAIKDDNEALADSKLKTAEQINNRLDKVLSELMSIDQRCEQLSKEAEDYFKYLDKTKALLEEIKGTENEVLLSKNIISRENMVWAKIREGVQEEAKLKLREKKLLERETKLKEKLIEISN